MPSINLIDSALTKTNEEKELSVQISMNSFSFCISTVKEKSVMAFRSYKFTNAVLFEDILNQTEALLKQDELLSIPFSETRFLYIDRKSTLVPHEFFEPDLSKQYFEFNQPIDDLDELHYNSIFRIKSNIVFAVPTYLAGSITDKFKNVEFYNQAMPLIDILGSLADRNGTYQVLINLNKDFFDIVVYQGGKLLLYNSFLYTSTNDLIYFILFVCKQLEIDHNTAVFYILGECSDRQDITKELTAFIKNIERPKILQDLVQTIKLKDDLILQYATLLKLI